MVSVFWLHQERLSAPKKQAVSGMGVLFLLCVTSGAVSKTWVTLASYGLTCLGFGLNVLVILLNDGRVLVRAEEIPEEHQESYEPICDHTRVRLLGDRIPVGSWLCSPGNICFLAAFLILIAKDIYRWVGLLFP